MYSTIRRYQKYLVIGAIFSISLLISHPSGQVWAQFWKSPLDPNTINYDSYSSDSYKLYVAFPPDWTLTPYPKHFEVRGDGALLEITSYLPVPGSFFPSVNTPVEQVVDEIIKRAVSPNARPIQNQNVYGMVWGPPYLLSYNEDLQSGEVVRTDLFLYITGGKLYQVKYT